MRRFGKGQALIAGAIGIAVAAIVIGAVAVPILAEVNTTDWSSINVTIFTYVSTFLILSLLIGAIAYTGLTRGR